MPKLVDFLCFIPTMCGVSAYKVIWMNKELVGEELDAHLSDNIIEVNPKYDIINEQINPYLEIILEPDIYWEFNH